MKKNDQPIGDWSGKPNFNKNKVGQSSSNSLGKQSFWCQGYGHVKVECPTYLRFKGKAMAVTLSDDEESNHESDSDQEGKFNAFTVIAVVDESIEENVKSPSDKELSENANLQEAYNKLCKNATKDAINADLSLKKIDILEL